MMCCVLHALPPYERGKPLAFWLGAFFYLTATPLAYAAAPTHPTSAASAPPKAHSLSLKEKITQTEQALATEQDDQKAQALMKKAETLRLYTVQNSGRLLLSEAQEAIQKGHTDEAERALSAALTLQPDNAFLRRQRAAIRFIGNDLTGTVEDLQVALVHDPGDAQSWDLLARTQEHLHHPHQALHAYTEALTHAPLLPNGQKRYQQLEQRANGTPD
ncbi:MULTISPECIES: tetratricopeptide repeat protein [Bombella]|uniref:Tetratricopeptide repeat protein n=1 Tax=Bombella pollinis TaxID=2967337 RepID=A0ABT3WIN6_9PROT|nr:MULTISPECIES: hypothetical protein [Bombella]MCX5618970.1 hypothetical protein [Bombella pollinis]MUG04013.1 hypothetical protein [Bombella sp. ESL0378]MUG89507.1 hypothetical protein [Bombella sp. ESL0385]